MSNNERKELPIGRITLKSIGEQLLGIINLERGLFFTFWELLVRPGSAIESYLKTTRRAQFIKPFNFLLLTSGLVLFFLIKLELTINDFESVDWSFGAPKQETQARLMLIFEKIQEYGNAIQLLNVPLVSLVSFWVFKKAAYNFAEHLVINAYVASIQSLISILIILFSSWNSEIATGMSLLVLIYIFYAYRQIFNTQGAKGALQILVVFLGSQTLQFLLIAVGLTLYFLLNPAAAEVFSQ